VSLEALLTDLSRLAGAADDLNPAFRRAADVFRQAAEDHVTSGGGGAWPSWADSYATRTSSPQLLVREGDLLASLVDPGHRQHVERISGDSLEVGTARPTAVLHRHAKGSPSYGLPRRDPVPPLEAFEDAWVGQLSAHLGGDDPPRLGL